MEHFKRSTKNKLANAFGFNVEIISSSTFEAHGEKRIRYTAKRPNGKKYYHAIMYSNGFIATC